MLTKLMILAGLASSCYMTGLIVFVHRVHYPLFDRVPVESFRDFHAEHVRRTTPAVFVPMVIELVAALLLVFRRPEGVSAWLAWAGLAAVSACWLATAGLSVPLHDRLAKGFEAKAHQALVRTNTVRLVAWLAHAIIMLVMTAGALK